MYLWNCNHRFFISRKIADELFVEFLLFYQNLSYANFHFPLKNMIYGCCILLETKVILLFYFTAVTCRLRNKFNLISNTLICKSLVESEAAKSLFYYCISIYCFSYILGRGFTNPRLGYMNWCSSHSRSVLVHIKDFWKISSISRKHLDLTCNHVILSMHNFIWPD